MRQALTEPSRRHTVTVFPRILGSIITIISFALQ